ncbi:Polysialic acid capsule expression protein KpsF [Helicobacter sp. NHP19-012]|uniref:Polysialic acid capsule expression protein KpsF n=1 Tax=Helicobacter gastrofelis TaxID=2849642 RepID=A0ABM7SFL9_9HELI|nr:KpsF/GutQ family sugar-phosphate isomerase [Helicobacter sp. NHP19-012]BCZ18423.1 Polysialic acid capsule expression protein KpsF [Helicobacter sp. NHP19-012]
MDYAHLAAQSLDLAIEALQDAKSGLSHSTLKPIVELLGNAPLVVVMGVGKSAHIGHKIAATLTSTGTKAVFLHPTEAVHGDMGIVGEKDAILAISYGGESVELLEALRYIKCAGVVAMSKHKNSSLAKSASHHLELKIKKEACGFNLVPTTSTTLSLALGDVLAVCLMAYKNFSQEDFAKSHPGGLLGKKMHLRVKDIYRTTNLPLVDANCCLHEALLEATAKGLGNALLVDSGGHLVGVLSDGDIRRALLQPENFDLNAPAKNYATLKPRIITDLDMLVVEALELIEQTQISLLVVCDSKNQVLGVLHLHTLLSLGLGS